MPEEPLVDGTKHILLRTYPEQVIVPNYLTPDCGDVEVRGTGTLVEVGEKLYLITASHVFDGCDLGKLSSPCGRGGQKIRAFDRPCADLAFG